MEKLNLEVQKKIHSLFWDPLKAANTDNRNIKSFLYSLEKCFGILRLNDPKSILIKLSPSERGFLIKNGVSFGKCHAFYNSLIKKDCKKIRWALGSIYFKNRVLKIPPEKNILLDINNISKPLLNLIGYVKIKNIALEVNFLEKIVKNIFNGKKRVFYFDYSFLVKFKLSQPILNDILDFLGFTKIAGASIISYWIIRKVNYTESSYNTDSPFYILKKLQ